MVGKTGKIRLFSLIVSAAMLLSVTATAGAAPSDVVDAKDEIATVDITQVYNTEETDDGVHNYATDGREVNITYEAALRMTEEMALYLRPRQTQLLRAKFNVHVDMDLEWLEFNETGDTVTAVFTSTFLKPWDVKDGYEVEYPDAFASREDYLASGYTSELVDVKDGVFIYEISVNKAWAQKQDSFDVPMELIAYYDAETQTAYGYDQVKGKEEFADKPMYYSDFTNEDWTAPITLSLADMSVKAEKAKTVTSASSTWYTIKAKGTVDGEFSYITDPVSKIGSLAVFEELNYVTTLEFGNESTIEEWTSNEVSVLLKYRDSYEPVNPGKPNKPDKEPDSPYLNLEDHFAYIIGYPVDYVTGQPTDDMSRWPVKPQGTITRAEVATIFFRMLTDEVRNEYWSQVNPYSDVDIDDWYNNAISTLTNLGVIEGYPDGGFHPTGNITRAEFATMAVRFFVLTEDYTWTEDAFIDIGGHWANEYINLAYLLDIVSGYPDGTYKPQNAITRAEAMTIVNNTLRRSPVKEGLLPVEEMIMWPDNMDATTWYYEEVQEATNSHEYTYVTDLDGEQWTAPLPVRDWAAFERAWSDANSAANPGEVVDGN